MRKFLKRSDISRSQRPLCVSDRKGFGSVCIRIVVIVAILNTFPQGRYVATSCSGAKPEILVPGGPIAMEPSATASDVGCVIHVVSACACVWLSRDGQFKGGGQWGTSLYRPKCWGSQPAGALPSCVGCSG